jgi:hypothetical protein
VFLNPERAPENKNAWLIGAETISGIGSGFFADWNELNSTLISPVMTAIWAGEAVPAEVLPGLCEDVDAFLAERGYTAS